MPKFLGKPLIPQFKRVQNVMYNKKDMFTNWIYTVVFKYDNKFIGFHRQRPKQLSLTFVLNDIITISDTHIHI